MTNPYEPSKPELPIAHAIAVWREHPDGPRWSFWKIIVPVCPRCGRRHFHGGGKGAEHQGDGHRNAHCIEGGGGGYVIKVGAVYGPGAKPPKLPKEPRLRRGRS